MSGEAAAVQGDPVGDAFVRTLIARADGLPPAAQARLLARAAVLADHYRDRTAPTVAPSPPTVAPSTLSVAPSTPPGDDAARGWNEVLAARARDRVPRIQRTRESTRFVAELRAASVTARAAEQVPSSAGPYHGATVASGALAELLAVSPAYVARYVEWLEDLAALAEVAERRAAPRK